MTYSGAITLNPSTTSTVASGVGGNTNVAMTLSGVISGSGALTVGVSQSGSGSSVLLTNAETYTGATAVAFGALQVGNGTTAGSLTSSSSISLASSTTLVLDLPLGVGNVFRRLPGPASSR